MKKALSLTLFLAFLALLPSQGFAQSSFDGCVDALYKTGGLSIREAQEFCLKSPSKQMLSCQNNMFQVAFETPQQSLALCSQDENVDARFRNKAQVYRGKFQALPSGNKKTVCSITVNSEEERMSFQKVLPSADYDFVELLPQREFYRFVTRDTHWLDRVCQSEVRCDTMVFSGHFADSFIGDAGFEVSMRDLKNYRSKEKCGKFFESVKDVYLFGCNTMAGKKPDHRSIEQYIHVLVEDGVAPHTAQRISARRYTPYDLSVSEKMKEIFSNASFITGFPSTGPTGAKIQKTLEQYLDQVKTDVSLDEKVKSFRQTLGSLGMIYSLPKKSASTKTTHLVPDIASTLTKASVSKYTEQYAVTLPVATVDLIEAAFEQKLYTETEFNGLKKKLQGQWGKIDKWSQLIHVCPLSLADHKSWMPEKLDCQSDTSWLRER